ITSSPPALTRRFLGQVFRKIDLGLPQQVPRHVTAAAQGQRTLVVHRRFVVVVTFDTSTGTHSDVDRNF
ncbi:hypothetical protein K443DRAFT_684723, partial [Laccaria amethystina LaAM-08-1]